jgi:hypothetical protein
MDATLANYKEVNYSHKLAQVEDDFNPAPDILTPIRRSSRLPTCVRTGACLWRWGCSIWPLVPCSLSRATIAPSRAMRTSRECELINSIEEPGSLS